MTSSILKCQLISGQDKDIYLDKNIVVSLLLTLLLFTGALLADDSAVEVTPKGLQFKKMKEISLEHEDLYISTKKIEVTLQFRNNSKQDITTDIAFPIPDYTFTPENYHQDFGDFTAEVNGESIRLKKEERAFVNGKEYTDELKMLGISIYNFNGFNTNDTFGLNIFVNLTENTIDSLLKYGLIDTESFYPKWQVSLKYYWTQVFPAESTITIKHTYSPHIGFQYVDFRPSNSDTSKQNPERAFLIQDACLNTYAIEIFEKQINDQNQYVFPTWVSYVLATANNWSTSIKTFHLMIEKQQDENFVSMCYNYQIYEAKPGYYESTIYNFVPEKDLKVYFFLKR